MELKRKECIKGMEKLRWSKVQMDNGMNVTIEIDPFSDPQKFIKITDMPF